MVQGCSASHGMLRASELTSHLQRRRGSGGCGSSGSGGHPHRHAQQSIRCARRFCGLQAGREVAADQPGAALHLFYGTSRAHCCSCQSSSQSLAGGTCSANHSIMPQGRSGLSMRVSTWQCKSHSLQLPQETWRREHLWSLVGRLGTRLGVPVESPIIPLVLGAESETMRAAGELLAMGFHVPPIRPPTVKPMTCRCRSKSCASATCIDPGRRSLAAEAEQARSAMYLLLQVAH